jgi:hypothetical protein
MCLTDTLYISIWYFRTTGWLLFKLFFSVTPVTVTTRPSQSHVYFKHLFLTHTLQGSLDKWPARRKACTWDNTTGKHKGQTSMSVAGFQPAIAASRRPRPSPQTVRYHDPHKHYWHCLLNDVMFVLISDAISDSCYNVSLDHSVEYILPVFCACVISEQVAWSAKVMTGIILPATRELARLV